MSKSSHSVFDIFISYASEDRDAIARPLAEALRARRFSVWFDDYIIGAGDDVHAAITKGVRNARYGVVIISKSYLAKDWPRMELMSLWMHEGRIKRTIVLPVLHNISVDEVVAIDPAFKDRSMPSTSRGLDYVVDRILAVLYRQRGSDIQPIGHVTPQDNSWRAIIRGVVAMPLEVSGIAPEFRGMVAGLKVAFAYNGGIFAVMIAEAIAFALDWRLEVSEARVLLRDATWPSYLEAESAILLAIYLWVRIVWWLRRRAFSTVFMCSVIYAVAARLGSIPLATVLISRQFPNRSLVLNASLGALCGAGTILAILVCGRIILARLNHGAERALQAAA